MKIDNATNILKEINQYTNMGGTEDHESEHAANSSRRKLNILNSARNLI